MEETSDNARVWRVYLDESERNDVEMVNGWRGTLDTLLIFAGLFSAVVATFITQTAQSLQPDNAQARTLMIAMLHSQREMLSLHRALATGGNVSVIPDASLNIDTTFVPSSRDLWLNGVWIVSLGLSLSTALVIGLVKQWINNYMSNVNGTPKERSLTRHFRFRGLSLYGVQAVIELLPVLMNTTLLLFFVGLILFSQALIGAGSITNVIIGLTCASYGYYLVTSVIPIVVPQCPYRTSLTSVMLFLIQSILHSSAHILTLITPSSGIFPFNLLHTLRHMIKKISTFSTERRRVREQRDMLELDTIREMVSHSPHQKVQSLAAQALAGRHGGYPPNNLDLSKLYWTIRHFWRQTSHSRESFATAERLMRALGYCALHSLKGWGSVAWYNLSKISKVDANHPDTYFQLAAIRALVLIYEPVDEYEFETRTLGELIRRIFHLPSVEMTKLHPWVIHQLTNVAILSAHLVAHDAEDWNLLFEQFLRNLSFSRSPSLQEVMLINMLRHRNMSVADVRKRKINEKPSDPKHLSLDLIQTLPVIAGHFMSVVPSSPRHYCDLLYKILAQVFTRPYEHRGWSYGYLKVSLWENIELRVSRTGSDYSIEPQVLARLLQTLVSVETRDTIYAGDTSFAVRYKLILLLYDALCPQELHKVMLHAASKAIRPGCEAPSRPSGTTTTSSISLGAGDTEVDGDLENARDFVSARLSTYPIQTLGYYCSRFSAPNPDLVQSLRDPRQAESSLIHLHKLFVHFLDHGPPDDELIFPTTLGRVRKGTLAFLLRNVLSAYIAERHVPVRDLLKEWVDLLDQRLPEFVPLPEPSGDEQEFLANRRNSSLANRSSRTSKATPIADCQDVFILIQSIKKELASQSLTLTLSENEGLQDVGDNEALQTTIPKKRKHRLKRVLGRFEMG